MASQPTNSADKPPMMCAPCNLDFPGITEIKQHFNSEHPSEILEANSADVDAVIDEIVSEWYHRWVKYGYYGNGEDLDDDTEYNQAREQVKALLSDQVKAAAEEQIIQDFLSLNVEFDGCVDEADLIE